MRLEPPASKKFQHGEREESRSATEKSKTMRRPTHLPGPESQLYRFRIGTTFPACKPIAFGEVDEGLSPWPSVVLGVLRAKPFLADVPQPILVMSRSGRIHRFQSRTDLPPSG